jgi:hypothetical protein
MRSQPLWDLASQEDILIVVTRGMSHILLTNGYYKEETFYVPGRRPGLPAYPKKWLRHYRRLAEEVREFLAQSWPRISGINDPCILDEGSVRQHVAYLRCLPLFRESPKQQSWGRWSYGERGADSTNPDSLFHLCDRCRKYYNVPPLPSWLPAPSHRSPEADADLSALLGLDPDTYA